MSGTASGNFSWFFSFFIHKPYCRFFCEIHRENIPKIQYIRCISIHKLSFADAKLPAQFEGGWNITGFFPYNLFKPKMLS